MGFENWERVKLSDVATVYDSLHKSPKYAANGIPMIRVTDLSEGFLKIEDTALVDDDVFEEFSQKYKTSQGDIIFSRVGSYGIASYVNTNKKFCLGQNTVAIVAENIEEKFLYYSLISPQVKSQIEMMVTGSTQKTISLKSIRSFELSVPNRTLQKNISSFLFSLDEKIELNNSIIKKNEEIAQTLFKRWFVDFEFPDENGEPYKSSDGEMVESELGMIPRNWYVGSLNNLGKIVGGGTPSRKNEDFFTENGISWITPKDLSNDKSVYIYKGATDITEEGLKKSSAKLHPENTVLFSSRAPIGYVAIAGKRTATNQGFKSIVPFKGIPSEYIYTLLKNLTPEIEANAGGSTFKEISGAGMKGIKISVPSLEVLGSYHNVIMTVFNKIKSLEKENRILIDLRDMLLPKLLSGEIEIPDETEVTENVPIS